MIPSASNPLILRYGGQPPALKNSKVPLYRDGKVEKLIPNDEVMRFIKKCEVIKKQITKQGFDRMPFPMPVATYVEIYFAIQESHNIPVPDGDNAYTTLQETWQDPNFVRGLGAVLGVIDDDRQVLSCEWDVIPIKSQKLEGATVYLWELDWELDRFEQRDQFKAWYREHKAKRFDADATINFDEIDELFDKI